MLNPFDYTFIGTAQLSIYAGGKGFLDDLPVGDIVRFRGEFLDYLRGSHANILAALRDEKKFTDAIESDLNAAIEQFKQQFAVSES